MFGKIPDFSEFRAISRWDQDNMKQHANLRFLESENDKQIPKGHCVSRSQ